MSDVTKLTGAQLADALVEMPSRAWLPEVLEAARRLCAMDWIPVTERLPDGGEWVLVSVVDGFGRYVTVVQRHKDGSGWDYVNDRLNVTHWRPLPAAPA